MKSETDRESITPRTLLEEYDNAAGGITLGNTLVVTVFIFSLTVSMYHIWAHQAPLLATILGQGELLALSLLFGLAGYYTLTNVETPSERNTVGVLTGGGYVLTGLASSGYAWRQHLTPEAALDANAILFQATFMALVGGMAGIVVGFEKARRERTVADLEETTRELKATQAEIRTEKQRFESLFQNSPTAIADLQYTDGDPTVDRGNTAFEDPLEHTSADIEGKNLFEVVPLQETTTEEEVASHVRENEIYEGDVAVDRSGERERGHYKLRLIPYEVGNEGERAFALFTDVTELRKTQEELKESVDQLEVSNERLEQFAYAASHDLQEPLRMISKYLQLLENQYSDDLDDDASEFLAFARDGATRMQTLIEDLLQFSQVETQSDPLESVALESVIDDTRTDLQMRIEESNAEITTDDLARVEGDPSQLRQLFQNLLSNAIEYSGDESPRIHISAEKRGTEQVISVADEGIGIESDDQERIFEIFQRLHTIDEHAGSGIGLALCQRIVERHGGEIWANSDFGDGATFSFTVPISGELSAPPEASSHD